MELERIEIIETAPDPHIQWGQLQKIMELQEITYPELARRSNTPERTLRNILKGLTKDPRISTLLPIVRALGASIDRLVGLAPMRDIQREAAVFDVTLMDSMRQQVDTLEAQRAIDQAELDRLRKLVLSKGEALSIATERCASMDGIKQERAALEKKIEDQAARLEYKAEKIQAQAEEIAALREKVEAKKENVRNLESLTARQRQELWYMRVVILVLVTAIILLCAYFVWEVSNLDEGITAWLHPDIYNR